MKNRKEKILILHNIIAPYRLPIFEALSKVYDLEVFFSKAMSKDRKWNPQIKDYTFKYKLLPEIDLGPLYFNCTLLYNLLINHYDVYIVAECQEMALSILLMSIIAKTKRTKFIVWSGQTTKELYFSPSLHERNTFSKKIIYKLFQVIIHYYHIFIYSMADAFISYSRSASEFLFDYNIKRDKIFEGTQIMPEELLPKPTITKARSAYKDKIVFLSVGYLNKRKGIDLLINAFKKIDNKNAILMIVGTGEEEKNLKLLAKEQKNILFLGNKDGKEKANCYAIADVFIFPTLHDVWGLVVNEALYYKLPVICSSKAGASELIKNDNNGFIIGNINLQNKMKLLIDHPDTLKKLKNNLNKYNFDKIVCPKAVLEIFNNAISFVL